MPLTLTVAANVNRSGSVLIPAGSQLVNCNPPMEAPNLLLENWLYTRVDGSRLMPLPE